MAYRLYLNDFNTVKSYDELCKMPKGKQQREKYYYEVATPLRFYLSDKLYTIFEKPKSVRLSGEIHQYNLDGTYIKSYSSIKEAEQSLNMKLSGVNDAIKLNNSYYKGFLWARGEKLDSMTP